MRRILTIVLACLLVLGPSIETLAVDVGGQEDIQGPKLVNLTHSPVDLDVSTSSAVVNYNLHITDDLSGFDFGTILLKSPSQTQENETYFYPSDLVSGDINDGYYDVSITFPAFAEAGYWTISQLRLRDAVSNNSWYAAQSLTAGGFENSLLVSGGPDLAAPSLNGFSFEPPLIDVSNQDADVTFSFDIDDIPSGFSFGTVWLSSPTNIQEHVGYFYPSDLTSGDNNSGSYQLVITIPQYSEAGEWYIQNLRLHDYAGNDLWLSTSQLEALGYETHITTVSEPDDVTGPQLLGMNYDPESVNVSESDQDVEYLLDVRDLPAGFSFGSIWLRSPTGGQEIVKYFHPSDLILGSDFDGTYSVVVTFPRYSETGQWHLELLRLQDNATNDTWYGPDDLQNLGFEPNIEVSYNSAPIAMAGGPYIGYEGQPVALSAAGSYDAEDSVLSYAWDLDGDGQFIDAYGRDISTTFEQDGVYSVSVLVTDSDGSNDVDQTSVTISNLAPEITSLIGPLDPIQVGNQANFSLEFSDAGVLDSHTVSWNWGDGTLSEVVAENLVNISHTYTQTGVYEVEATVTDSDGAMTSSLYRYVVVYDPEGGFVTGGGWIVPGGSSSEPGDILPFIDGTSKANFGFVVKYHTGATTPEGNLEFHYNAGDFHLHSLDTEWLVVTNQNWGHFFGNATIDGLEGIYPFKVSAFDGDSDRFTIKIWAPGSDPDNTEPIYKASGDLGGGQIKIHN